MTETLPEIDKTSRLVQEITAASIEQKNGVEQINSAIQQLNNVTQQTASASEELATSSEELASQAVNLNNLVSYFKISEDEKSDKFKQLGGAKKMETNNKQEKKSTNIGTNLTSYDVKDDEFENF